MEAAVKNINALKTSDLLGVMGFFWDLHRTKLLYPAYRMHGGKFAKELLARWNKNPNLVLEKLDDVATQRAVLLFSAHRFWGSGYRTELPIWYREKSVQQHPIFLAAHVSTFLGARYHRGVEDFEGCSEILRESAEQQDPYLRHWFMSLADDLDEIIAKENSKGAFRRFDPYGDDEDDFDDDDDEDDVESGFDPYCDCPECRAAKRKSGTPSWID